MSQTKIAGIRALKVPLTLDKEGLRPDHCGQLSPPGQSQGKHHRALLLLCNLQGIDGLVGSEN